MKNWLRNWALKSLLLAPLPSDTLAANKHGVLFRNGEALTSAQLSKLQAEVKLLKETELFDLLMGTPSEYAKKMMFEKATSFEDMVAGKMVLYALDIQKKVLDMIEKGRPL